MKRINKTRFLLEIMPSPTEEKLLADLHPLMPAERMARVFGEPVNNPEHLEADVTRDGLALAIPSMGTRYRVRCLRCAKQIGGVVTFQSWPYFEKLVREHKCKATAPTEHWRQVARDAFLEGRDEEAIEIIKSAQGLVAVDNLLDNEKANGGK